MIGEGGSKDRWERLVANEVKDTEQDARLDVIETPPDDILDFITSLDQGLS